MTLTQRLIELEHATIRPPGEYPSHCGLCRQIAETRKLQATCSHPADERIEIDVTALGALRQQVLVNCRLCGKHLK